MKVFQNTSEIAISTEDLCEILEIWLSLNFKVKRNGNEKIFNVSNIIHCRSSSKYALRFNVEDDEGN